jgi:hypothetical protein
MRDTRATMEQGATDPQVELSVSWTLSAWLLYIFKRENTRHMTDSGG